MKRNTFGYVNLTMVMTCFRLIIQIFNFFKAHNINTKLVSRYQVTWRRFGIFIDNYDYIHRIIYYRNLLVDLEPVFESLAGLSSLRIWIELQPLGKIHLNFLVTHTLRKICQNSGFLWSVFYRIRTVSRILSLSGENRSQRQPLFGHSLGNDT